MDPPKSPGRWGFDGQTAAVPDEEIPLEGGNLTAGVVRVGDTVRRPTGPHSTLAHEVLRHLEAVGFPHAPRLLGVDDQGREVLTYVPGATIWPNVPDAMDTDDGLARGAALVRDLHAAMPTVDGALVLHGDLAPWNIVVGPDDDDPWVLIDWDGVEIGERAWELAYVLHTFIPLWPDFPIAGDDDAIVHRLAVFADVYGGTRELLDDALCRVPAKCRSLAATTDARAATGEPAFQALVDDGHPQRWRDAADHVEAMLPCWRADA